MADATLSQARFHDDDAARQYLEDIRWPNGAICPHCGGTDRNSAITGKSARAGLYFCGDCRTQFTVTVGTVFERSKISLSKWVMATHLMCASKKGISAKQLERMLGVTYKTAWFMAHRIREAMKSEGGMMGGTGGAVEADETYVGGKEKNKHRSKRVANQYGGLGKQMVFSLVERSTGQVRSMHLTSVNAKNLFPVLKKQLHSKTRFMTDGEGQYRILAPMFHSHEVVNHSAGEYVRGDIYTNTVEGYFSILKRGIVGTFHHVSEQHLQRYATEFDFRYNNRSKLGIEDTQRTAIALKGISGKRLTYRRTNAAAQ